jgi:serine phosphatase RsbU (regulator of sigma subunit)
LLLRAESGRIERLSATGHPLWVLAGARVRAGTPTRLEEGDTLLACSDGVTEARGSGGDLYGLGRLGAALALYGHLAPDRLIACLRADLKVWAPGPLEDDLTLVALGRRSGEPPRPVVDSVS